MFAMFGWGFIEIALVFGLLFVPFIYFTPSILGFRTKHFRGIFIVNLFLGWTFVGWVGALAWAVIAPRD